MVVNGEGRKIHKYKDSQKRHNLETVAPVNVILWFPVSNRLRLCVPMH